MVFFGFFLHFWLANVAVADQYHWLTIDGQRVKFIERETPPVLISAKCLQLDGTLKCAAWTKTQSMTKTEEKLKLKGDDHPGALICQNLRGKKIIATDTGGNETLFCRFSDGSMISSGSLHAKALINAQTKRAH